MDILKAIKRAEKLTGIKIECIRNKYYIVKNGMELSFFKNGGDSSEAICFKTRRINNKDEVDIDRGVFWDNLTQAINYLNN